MCAVNRIVKFRQIKREIRILGIDDSSFSPRKTRSTTLVGIVFRGGLWLDGVMKTRVKVDGLDATEKIVEMIKSSPHYRQLRVTMLNGITFAGFNIVNIKKLFELTGLPVIAITKEKPCLEDVKNALMNLPNQEERWNSIQDAGQIIRTRVRNSDLYMQIAGISKEDTEDIVHISCTRGNIPEPLRVAHIVASGLAEAFGNMGQI